MFSFFQKKESQEQQMSVPDWASFFTSEESVVFIKSVSDYFNKLNIQYKTNYSGSISVDKNDFNLQGKQLVSACAVSSLSLSDLPSGLYIIQVKTGGEIQTAKIVK